AAQADAEATAAYRVEVVKNTATENSTALDTSVVLFDAAPLFKAILDDMAAGVSVGVIARRFHDAMVEVIVMSAQLAEAAYGVRTVVLSGGVFMNRYLMEHAVSALGALGYTAAMNKDLPPNDACISYGQAVVALRTIDTLPAGE
ncbi:MAG: hydrogenase maturation protein HypF, partial [Eggerthellaceae bacterium]|nr:hydrogenase maturation protein HypF [Eggerthellaceae bacterium]